MNLSPKLLQYVFHLTGVALNVTRPAAKQDTGGQTELAVRFTPAELSFTSTPVPDHYPLLDRGFHFVNQWGLER